ncbi:hypothetical protein GW17_00054255 [Ensete ventricosum]|nr:hypothetical protein GW17_00054255 [Ensete ventricosum]
MVAPIQRSIVPDDPMRTTRIWYTRLKSSSIFCFNQLAKEFELNFLVSARLRLTIASLLWMSQKDNESLA